MLTNNLNLDICIAFYYNFNMKKYHKNACKNGLPDDEHVMVETSRRHEELNWNINLKSVHFAG